MAIDRDQPDGFQPSILDRLVDFESGGTADQRGYTEKQLADAVRRDLEELLNTRRPEFDGLEISDFPQVQKSVIGYGLPDFTNLRSLSDDDRQSIGRQIGEAIATFEPRLTDVVVHMKDPKKLKDEMKEKFQLTAIYFHIEAKLRMDPCPPVTFETMLELTQGRHRINGGIVE
ncbi:MAG: type VI secretion system baseplate subunit TssE [Gemmataceae bacterium]|nr:type VI secretion system baseplate subunit TssE [Gemmataceae bacterium]